MRQEHRSTPAQLLNVPHCRLSLHHIQWAAERRASFGWHFIPHDGDRESLWLEGGTKGVMSGLRFHPTVVERPKCKEEAIAAARTALARGQFDKGACELGLRRLRAYRKESDES